MAVGAALLSTYTLSFSFGRSFLFSDVSFSIPRGGRIALVGRNGSGKSTLLKILAGEVEPTGGTLSIQKGVSCHYMGQNLPAKKAQDAFSYLAENFHNDEGMHRAYYLLDALGLEAHASIEGFSGGQLRKLDLARLLLAEADVLLLDEPTNHLDIRTIEWLETELTRSKASYVVISHDKKFLENVSNTTLWLEGGKVHYLPRGFACFEEWRNQIWQQELKERQKLAQKISAEEDWLRYGVTGRRKRNIRRVNALQDLREQQDSSYKDSQTLNLAMNDTTSSGQNVIKATAISKSFSGLKVVEDFSIEIHRGEKIGIVGANGSGKTTLLLLLTGELAPEKGKIEFGTHIEKAFLDQKRQIDEEQTVEHYLTEGYDKYLWVQGEQRHVYSYMKEFLFLPEQAGTAIKKLSGGERARLILAHLLAKPVNLLILDEPTNDLDMDTLEILEERLRQFKGTVLIISHDRSFLNNVVTSVIVPQGQGQWIQHRGGYSSKVSQELEAYKKTLQKQKRETKKPSGEKQKNRQKLSYKQLYALENLPKRIEALQGEISLLQEQLKVESFYLTDKEGFMRCANRLAQKQKTLQEQEEAWLELALLQEALQQ